MFVYGGWRYEVLQADEVWLFKPVVKIPVAGRKRGLTPTEYRSELRDGLGFQFQLVPPYVGIDLDKYYDPETSGAQITLLCFLLHAPSPQR